MDDSIRIGISACLLGHEVRYDGGLKRDPYIIHTLGRYLHFVPLCPEVECGMGVPREPVRLVGDPEAPRMKGVKSGRDHTAAMRAWARKRVRELAAQNLWGFIFKSNSPSCGIARVKVYRGKGPPMKRGVGLFARAFQEHFPLLPVVDESGIHDPGLRENLIEALFTMKNWRDLLGGRKSRGMLADFHDRHKLLLMAHGPGHCREMERLLASDKRISPRSLYARYQVLLLDTLRRRATPPRHVNVLRHAVGCLRKTLTPEERRELLESIEDYRRDRIPLIVPVTLVNHYVRKYGDSRLAAQVYLRPHPLALHLRNHA
ncbi:MAG: DUF523 and DUF1722 domain-containing protein [Deltaproteobacteria bacterium]|nr:DUF523 and DUF1722 domain-containing protein [Deltaproteobacteria bacterium]MBW1924670.1 DUF523 and DUF1722 domain-containing protein [Deltaproteobacteria bacterium]MBW1948117.1 DUF523 and DUF1722 domain-containing protein [Deltaproteobacteria bacterium]MBW2008232.1 DUF523 and DUF1722 domain-containing protein [Deltaproteobacteria bacterium]MBW2101975.1 DUF523 and DUF1722 domain-containing protein [Deltaproteobacteria bacterium]